ncbi:MAG: carbohydrate ABC transporter permease [Caldilineaceae bacterium]|nr:carbohydrate ABC transporter permease [Caldilineaceae bacterium]MCB0187658.1 carbohydrate ABC transporter permease [Caldilineaceae bacterium]
MISLQSKRFLTLINKTITFLILLGAALVFLLPLFWMLSTSLKPKDQIFAYPLVWLPHPPQWENYAEALNNPSFKYLLFLQNSLIYAVMSTIGTVVSCAFVAYAFARLRWWGRDFWFVITLSTMMIPYPVTLIPLFLIFRDFGWIGTFKPLIVPSFLGTPFFIFLLRQFFLTIPMDLSDAARIDGAREVGIFWHIILPLTRPALITVALFTFLGSWNDFLGPLIYLNDGSKYTLAVGLAAFRGQYRTQWDLMMAASTVVTVPIVVLFFFAQKRFIQGITLTGMKG